MASAIQNRTVEFQQCVASFDKIHKVQPQRQPQGKKSRFAQQAAAVARDIAHTTELLQKLALLAKRKPLFDDRPVEIGELTYVIKQDLYKIGQSIKALQQFAKGELLDPQVAQNLKNVVSLLNLKVQNVNSLFRTVLETRQRNELLNKSRTEHFVSAATSRRAATPLLENALLANLGENPYLYTQQEQPQGTELLLIPDQTQQMLLLEEQSNEYLQQRNSAVETIEATINEVGNMFQQLATMVSEQGETIQRIDQNVDDIDINIQGAQRELLKYYARILNNRWLFLKIFGVLLVFFFLWVMVS